MFIKCLEAEAPDNGHDKPSGKLAARNRQTIPSDTDFQQLIMGSDCPGLHNNSCAIPNLNNIITWALYIQAYNSIGNFGNLPVPAALAGHSLQQSHHPDPDGNFKAYSVPPLLLTHRSHAASAP